MAVASAAVLAGINVLLSVLSCEVNVVSRLALGLARHAGVAVRDVKAARVACVPVCETFNKIGIRGPLLQWHAAWRGISWHATLRGIAVHVAPTSRGRGHCICRGKHAI